MGKMHSIYFLVSRFLSLFLIYIYINRNVYKGHHARGRYWVAIKIAKKYNKEKVKQIKASFINERTAPFFLFLMIIFQPTAFYVEEKAYHRLRSPHPAIVQCYGTWSSPQHCSIVLELMDYDLTSVIRRIRMPEQQIKSLLFQLFSGLAYLHRKMIIHLDIKCDNILLNKQGDLKICDFGLSFIYYDHMRIQASDTDSIQWDLRKSPQEVVTLWYRPLEILYRTQRYHTEVDMWSAGCVMGEMFTGMVLFPGKSIEEQAQLIYNLCGTPHYIAHHQDLNENTCLWYGAKELKGWERLRPKGPEQIPTLVMRFAPYMRHGASTLLDSLCCLDPNKRITAEEAMRTDYFRIEWPAAEKTRLY